MSYMCMLHHVSAQQQDCGLRLHKSRLAHRPQLAPGSVMGRQLSTPETDGERSLNTTRGSRCLNSLCQQPGVCQGGCPSDTPTPRRRQAALIDITLALPQLTAGGKQSPAWLGEALRKSHLASPGRPTSCLFSLLILFCILSLSHTMAVSMTTC